jgi:hypothetical protein
MASDQINAYLAAAVVTDGTITFAYPSDRDADSYEASGEKLWIDAHDTLLAVGAGAFSVAYGEDIVVTYLGDTTIPANSRVTLEAPVLEVPSFELISEDGTTVEAGDPDLPDLTATAAFDDSDNTEILADVEVLRAAIKSLANRVNELQGVLADNDMLRSTEAE